MGTTMPISTRPPLGGPRSIRATLGKDSSDEAVNGTSERHRTASLVAAPLVQAECGTAVDEPTGSARGAGRLQAPSCVSDATTPPIEVVPPSATSILESARREHAMYDGRVRRLGEDLASGVVWNMLLDLLINEAGAKPLSVMALSIGSRAPSATAIRYISLMEKGGVVERVRDAADARRTFIRLTTEGRTAVLDLLASR